MGKKAVKVTTDFIGKLKIDVKIPPYLAKDGKFSIGYKEKLEFDIIRFIKNTDFQFHQCPSFIKETYKIDTNKLGKRFIITIEQQE